MMQTYSLFIHDRRYSVPTLQFIVASDETRVRELARRELLASPDHLAVDVRNEGGEIFRQERSRG